MGALQPNICTMFDLNSEALPMPNAPPCDSRLITPASSENTSPEEIRLEVELKRVYEENSMLFRMLKEMYEGLWALQSKMDELIKNEKQEFFKGKRKSRDEENNVVHREMVLLESSCSDDCRKKQCSSPSQDSSEVYYRTDPSDTSMLVADDYQWRKYGQKVTRDNPSPRAYFKCSFSPACPVKKKVQRSACDRTLLVVTYEGKHNHAPPFNVGSTSTQLSACCALSTHSNHVPHGTHFSPSAQEANLWINSVIFDKQGFQQLFAEQVAVSLLNDQNFTSALASALSCRYLQHPPPSNL